MKRLALSITAALAAIVGVTSLVGNSGAQAPAPPTGTLELVSLDREVSFKFIDNPPRRRENAGDLFMISGRLRDSSDRPTGRFHASFAETQTRQSVAQGAGTFDVGDGQIVVAGVVDDRGRNDRTDTVAIVGGTGAYTAARGTLVVTERRRSSRYVFTFAG
jgi:hypothetical protein